MTIRRRIKTGRIRAELRDGKYFIPIEVEGYEQERRAPNVQPMRSSHGQIVKSHPNPDRTRRLDYGERPEPYPHRSHEHSSGHTAGASVHTSFSNHRTPPVRVSSQHIPESMVRPLVEAGLASVEAKALIEFCDRALEQAKDTVQSVEARYTSEMEALTTRLKSRDHEIKSLNQQIEDLQLLVQILERKKVV
jgi:polyhydroxyalkanoate synthesis regulator phasin